MDQNRSRLSEKPSNARNSRHRQLDRGTTMYLVHVGHCNAVPVPPISQVMAQPLVMTSSVV